MDNTVDEVVLNKDDAKLFDFPLSSNRNFARVNRACAALQANVMSLISNQSIKNLKTTINTNK